MEGEASGGVDGGGGDGGAVVRVPSAETAALLERLERRFTDMQSQLEHINVERVELEQVNRRMDVEIEVGTAVVDELRERAAQMEDENEKRKAENKALRERIRAMHEACARLDKK